MDKDEMLESLINQFTDGNQAKFAKKLGITPQALSKWIERKSFNPELIYKKIIGVSARWLLNDGEGSMLESIDPELSSSMAAEQSPSHKQNVNDDKPIDTSERSFYQQQITFLNEQLKQANERNSELQSELLNLLREKRANVG